MGHLSLHHWQGSLDWLAVAFSYLSSPITCRWLKGVAIPEKRVSLWLRNYSCPIFFFYLSLVNLSWPSNEEQRNEDTEYLQRQIPYRITLFCFSSFPTLWPLLPIATTIITLTAIFATMGRNLQLEIVCFSIQDTILYYLISLV